MNTRTIPIVGPQPSALDIPLELDEDTIANEQTQTLHEIIQNSGLFSGLEPSSQTHDIRKHFLLTTKAHFDDATEWTDTALKEMCAFMPKEHVLPDFPVPRRANNPAHESSIVSVAKSATLENLSEEERLMCSKAPVRNQRKRVSLSFSVVSFPNSDKPQTDSNATSTATPCLSQTLAPPLTLARKE